MWRRVCKKSEKIRERREENVREQSVNHSLCSVDAMEIGGK